MPGCFFYSGFQLLLFRREPPSFYVSALGQPIEQCRMFLNYTERSSSHWLSGLSNKRLKW